MPEPLNEQVRSRFRSQRTKDTACELEVRRRLHAQGLRYRIHVRPEPSIRTEADIVFRSARVAVFIDGCFWHGCPDHFVPPKNNASWWAEKIEANRSRDARARSALVKAGWLVSVHWEHAVANDVASQIVALVRNECS